MAVDDIQSVDDPLDLVWLVIDGAVELIRQGVSELPADGPTVMYPTVD